MFSLGKHEMFRAQKQPFEQNDTREKKKHTHEKKQKQKYRKLWIAFQATVDS